MDKMKIEYLPVESLTPYDKNARKHGDFDVGIIKKSIEQFGFNDPIGIWGDKNIIVEGHGRLQAAKELGMKEVPVIRLDHLTDEQRKMYALEHNRSAEMSSWDIETLMEELDQLSDFDLEGLGFGEFFLTDDDDLEAHDDDFNEDDFIPEVACSQLGDIYVLGRHRVMCGDSTNPEMVNALMDGATADFCLTDPPYNVNYTANGTREGIENDSMSKDDFREFMLAAYTNMYDHLKDGANLFIFHSDSEEINFRVTFEDAGFKWHQNWQWVKQSIVLGHGWAHYQNEPIIVGFKPGAAHYVTGRRDLSTVLNFDRPTKSKEHPTQKPTELLSYLIKEGSKKGDLCIDFFLGSASTLVACEQLERTCYGMELDPKYADVDVKRYLRLKGSDDGCYLLRDGNKLPLPPDLTSVLN